MLKAYEDSDGVLSTRMRVLFVGTGSEEEEFRNKIDEKGLSDSLFLLGYQDNPYKWIAKSDLLICPSYREGLSTAVTEALLLGIPVIATDCGGTRELLGDSQYGFVVDNDEEALLHGLLRISGDDGMRSEYAELARRRGRAFTRAAVLKENIGALLVVMGK